MPTSRCNCLFENLRHTCFVRGRRVLSNLCNPRYYCSVCPSLRKSLFSNMSQTHNTELSSIMCNLQPPGFLFVFRTGWGKMLYSVHVQKYALHSLSWQWKSQIPFPFRPQEDLRNFLCATAHPSPLVFLWDFVFRSHVKPTRCDAHILVPRKCHRCGNLNHTQIYVT